MTAQPDDRDQRALLRRQVLARRDALPAEQRQEKSRALAACLANLDCYRQARTILFFVSFRSEVDTRAAMAMALARGVRLAVPLTSRSDRELRIYAVTDLDADLVPGYQGILEPDPRRCPVLDAAGLDLVIVPGSVFDRQGGRMGYGGGYYDRFLARRAPQAIRVGICFDLQLVAAVPMAAHDQYVDYVVTESAIVVAAHKKF